MVRCILAGRIARCILWCTSNAYNCFRTFRRMERMGLSIYFCISNVGTSYHIRSSIDDTGLDKEPKNDRNLLNKINGKISLTTIIILTVGKKEIYNY